MKPRTRTSASPRRTTASLALCSNRRRSCKSPGIALRSSRRWCRRRPSRSTSWRSSSRSLRRRTRLARTRCTGPTKTPLKTPTTIGGMRRRSTCLRPQLCRRRAETRARTSSSSWSSGLRRPLRPVASVPRLPGQPCRCRHLGISRRAPRRGVRGARTTCRHLSATSWRSPLTARRSGNAWPALTWTTSLGVSRPRSRTRSSRACRSPGPTRDRPTSSRPAPSSWSRPAARGCSVTRSSRLRWRPCAGRTPEAQAARLQAPCHPCAHH
mmetsp:Transcript_26898/g.85180  ORF Transcript_26898/g.85180 Transcript_26898/m.85180 type:complete len:268 (+) Transcript_26898:395-1198(+)